MEFINHNIVICELTIKYRFVIKKVTFFPELNFGLRSALSGVAKTLMLQNQNLSLRF